MSIQRISDQLVLSINVTMNAKGEATAHIFPEKAMNIGFGKYIESQAEKIFTRKINGNVREVAGDESTIGAANRFL